MTDQLPPHSLDAEAALVGSLLLDRDAIAAVADWVTPEAFFHAPNGIVFRAMLALWKVRRPCDLVTLTALLESRRMLDQAGGVGYLAGLMAAPPFSVNAAHYGEIVMEHAKRRAIIDAGAAMVKAAYEGDVEVDDLVGRIRRADAQFALPQNEDANTFAAGMEPARNNALNRWAGLFRERIVPCGIADIDARTYGGFRGNELIYIGGRPGSGKTAMAMQMAMNAARSGKHALIVELEMSKEALFNRAIAAHAGVPFGVAYQKVGDVMQRDRWLQASDELEALLVTVETKLYTTDKIAAYCERATGERPVDIVFIDHLDYLADPDLSRETVEQRTAKTSKRLKRLSTDLDIPVVVLSQLNRSVEDAPPYKPSLNHFRYSGAVEQDAEFAFLIYRRRYYVDRGMLEPSETDYIESHTNQHRVELMIAKHRNGEVGAIELGWKPESMLFTERRKTA